MWKKVFVYSGIPVLLIATVNAYRIESEHHKHLHEHPVQYHDLSYLHIRNKPFPCR